MHPRGFTQLPGGNPTAVRGARPSAMPSAARWLSVSPPPASTFRRLAPCCHPDYGAWIMFSAFFVYVWLGPFTVFLRG